MEVSSLCGENAEPPAYAVDPAFEEEHVGPHGNPSVDQIKARCAVIQGTWGPGEENRRRVGLDARRRRWMPPELTADTDGPAGVKSSD